MSQGLRELWGLGEPQQNVDSNALAGRFRERFSQAMERVNSNLQDLVASVPPAKHQKASAQRDVLYAAYQKAQGQIQASDAAEATTMAKRVAAAVGIVDKQAIKATHQAQMGREEWRARESEFGEIDDQIRALEDTSHPKAGALRKVADTIRSQANNRNFPAALDALNQLTPKLRPILQELDGAAPELPADHLRDLNDLTDELKVAKDFITLWSNALEDVAAQVEALRNAMKDNTSPRVRCIYDGLTNVMQQFPDLDLSKLVDAAQINNREGYIKTLKQTSREVKQVRDLLAKGPLLSTIDKNPYYKTNVHKTVNEALNVIARVLRVP